MSLFRSYGKRYNPSRTIQDVGEMCMWLGTSEIDYRLQQCRVVKTSASGH
jgi:hypothetical protein